MPSSLLPPPTWFYSHSENVIPAIPGKRTDGNEAGSLAGISRESPHLLPWVPHSSLTQTAEVHSQSEGRSLTLSYLEPFILQSAFTKRLVTTILANLPVLTCLVSKTSLFIISSFYLWET